MIKWVLAIQMVSLHGSVNKMLGGRLRWNNISSGGGGDLLPYKRDVGWGSAEISKRTPKRYHDPLLWAWLENGFTSKWYQVKNNISPVMLYPFRLSTLQGNTSHCGAFKTEHLQSHQDRFFNP